MKKIMGHNRMTTDLKMGMVSSTIGVTGYCITLDGVVAVVTILSLFVAMGCQLFRLYKDYNNK